MQIENVLKRSPDYGAFQKFVRKLIGEIYERSGGLATKKIINGHDLNSVKMQVSASSIGSSLLFIFVAFHGYHCRVVILMMTNY